MKELLTLEVLKQILKDYGFSVYLDAEGTPHLSGKAEDATPELMAGLAYWRMELIAELKRGKS